MSLSYFQSITLLFTICVIKICMGYIGNSNGIIIPTARALHPRISRPTLQLEALTDRSDKAPILASFRSFKGFDKWKRISDIWPSLAETWPDQVMLQDDREMFDTPSTTITFKQFSELINQTALSFNNLGVTPGMGIAMFSENSPRWLVLDQSLMKVRPSRRMDFTHQSLLTAIYCDRLAHLMLYVDLQHHCQSWCISSITAERGG